MVESARTSKLPSAVQGLRPSRVILGLFLAAVVAAGISWGLSSLAPVQPPSPLFANAAVIRDLQQLVQEEPQDAAWWLRLSEGYLAEQHWLSAVDSLKMALANGAEELTIRRKLFRCYTKLAQHQLALVEARRIVVLRPHSLQARIWEADTQIALGDTQGARRALRSIPTDPRGLPLIGERPLAERLARFQTRDGRLITAEASSFEEVEDDPTAQREALAAALLRAEDFRTSLDLALKSVDHSPSRFGPYLTAGVALTSLGRKREAARYFRPARLSGQMQLLSAQCLLAAGNKGDRREAEKLLTQALKLEPTLGRAWWELALIHEERSQWREAADAYVRANQFGTEQPRAALLAARLMRRLGDADAADLLFGTYYQQAGDPAKALRHYQLRLQRHPEMEGTHRQVAGALKALQRHPDRIRVLEAARSRFPQSAEMTVALARAYAEANLQEDVFRLLEEAARSESPSPQVVATLASAYNSAGRMKQSGDTYRRLIRLSPEYPGPRLSLARLLMAQQDQPKLMKEAVKLLEEAIRLDRSDPAILQQLGLAYAAMGRKEDAVLALRHAVDLSPGDGTRYQPLGDALRKLGKEDEASWMLGLAKRYREFVQAQEILTARVSRSPKDAEAVRALARYFTRMQAPLQAEREYRRLLTLSPRDADALRSLAAIYGQMGRTVDQQELLARLSRSSPA